MVSSRTIVVRGAVGVSSSPGRVSGTVPRNTGVSERPVHGERTLSMAASAAGLKQ